MMPILALLDRVRPGRIERRFLAGGEHQAGVPGQQRDRDDVLVLRLHLDRVVIEADGDVGRSGDQGLQHLRSAGAEVLGGDVEAPPPRRSRGCR